MINQESPVSPRLIDETGMPPLLDAAIRASLCDCFPADTAVFHQTRAWHGSKPSFTVLLEKQNRVIAHVGVVDRTIRAGDTPLRVAGVQNVFVLPGFRGQGLSSQVLRTAMAEAARRDFDGGLLFCVPQLEKVYAPHGWQGLGWREVIRVEEGREIPIPDKNIAMFNPLRIAVFPDGRIHLQGNDW
jgi:GNAT superfamily N-acetyltransferase